MNNTPFTIYDFFGYLASGFVILITFDYAFDKHWVINTQLDFISNLLLIIIAYVVGQINANFSGWLLERLIVNRLLKSPFDILMHTTKQDSRFLRILFPGYYTALPQELRDRTISKAKSYKIKAADLTLFHHIRNQVSRDPRIWQRLEVFLAQYGFCRNISLAFFVSSAFFAIAFFSGETEWKNFIFLSLLAAIGMFYRYLKFYRQYSSEMLSAYPEVETLKGV